MKVFDLRCTHDHRFEGWFASSEAFDDQLARGLVACPLCGVTAIERMPSAPRLNLSAAAKDAARSAGEASRKDIADEANHHARAPSAPVVATSPGQVSQAQGEWLQKLREVIQNTENVGEAFAEEARRIHYQEAPERAIRGVASQEQVAELADEGIDVFALPIPDAAKGSLQ